MKEELFRAKSDYEATERSLQDQISDLTRTLDAQDAGDSKPRGDIDGDYEALLAQHEELRAELKEQREVCRP